MDRRQVSIRLAPLRAAIRGWDISKEPRAYLQAGLREKAKLPETLHVEANRLLAGLQQAVAMRGK